MNAKVYGVSRGDDLGGPVGFWHEGKRRARRRGRTLNWGIDGAKIHYRTPLREKYDNYVENYIVLA